MPRRLLFRASIDAEAYDWVVLIGTMLGAVNEVAMALCNPDDARHPFAWPSPAASPAARTPSGGSGRNSMDAAAAPVPFATPAVPIFPTIPETVVPAMTRDAAGFRPLSSGPTGAPAGDVASEQSSTPPSPSTATAPAGQAGARREHSWALPGWVSWATWWAGPATPNAADKPLPATPPSGPAVPVPGHARVANGVDAPSPSPSSLHEHLSQRVASIASAEPPASLTAPGAPPAGPAPAPPADAAAPSVPAIVLTTAASSPPTSVAPWLRRRERFQELITAMCR